MIYINTGNKTPFFLRGSENSNGYNRGGASAKYTSEEPPMTLTDSNHI